MIRLIYQNIAIYLAPFFLLTTVVMFSICLWRGEIILGLQADALKNKDQDIKVIIEQHEGATKVSQEYEVRKADREQEKIYVDRVIEKIVSVPSYSTECFDHSGLLSLNNYISSINSSGKLKDAVPESTGDR